MLKTRISCVVVLALTVVTSACSESPARLSPTAPTAALVASSSVASTAGIIDRTEGYVRDGDVVATWAAQRGWAMAEGLVVEGTASITAATGTCPSVVMTVQGVPVTVNSATTFGTGVTCAGLTVGTSVHITGLLTFGAGSFTVVATNIGLGGSGRPPAPGGVEVEGVVGSVTGTCPALTITLERTGGAVITSATTTFRPSGSCGAIASGKTIEANGTRNSTGQLVATSVEVEDDEETGGPGRGRRVGGDGTIGAVTGTCPTLTMVVRGFRVHTTGSTVFENGACADIRPGTKAFIEGETRSDGGLRATRVRILARSRHGEDDR